MVGLQSFRNDLTIGSFDIIVRQVNMQERLVFYEHTAPLFCIVLIKGCLRHTFEVCVKFLFLFYGFLSFFFVISLFGK